MESCFLNYILRCTQLETNHELVAKGFDGLWSFLEEKEYDEQEYVLF